MGSTNRMWGVIKTKQHEIGSWGEGGSGEFGRELGGT